MEFSKATGLPLADGLGDCMDVPYSISLAVTYRDKINSIMELPEDKRPPRDLWDKPSRLNDFLDEVFERKKGRETTTKYIDFSDEDVE